MKVLVACEFSGVVRDAFAKRGHDATSCDLLPSDRPGAHILGDVRAVDVRDFDLMIAHPPCTDLAVSGARYFKAKIADGRQGGALNFIRWLLDAPVERIALENPIGVISSKIRKPDQIVQPWQFGHRESKATCWWLKGLPKLTPTSAIDPQWYGCCGDRFPFALGRYGCPNCHGEKRSKLVYDNQTPSGQNKLGPSASRAADRAVTYQGLADAMAEQWS